MQLFESSIFVNMKKLRERLYSAQFHMQKAERIIYGTPLMQASGEALGAFVIAFTVKEEKEKYMDLCVAWFTRLRVDLEFCVQENIIKFKKRAPKTDKDGNPIPWDDPRDAVSSQKVEMFALVAKIDDDMCKWRSAALRGKTLREK